MSRNHSSQWGRTTQKKHYRILPHSARKPPHPQQTGQSHFVHVGAHLFWLLPGMQWMPHSHLLGPLSVSGSLSKEFQNRMDTYFDGWRVIFKNLHDPHHAEGQIPRGSEEQRGREAADGDQHLHLEGKQTVGWYPWPAFTCLRVCEATCESR